LAVTYFTSFTFSYFFGIARIAIDTKILLGTSSSSTF
jgi:hypothetical protein